MGNIQRRKLSGLKDYKITDIKKFVRHGGCYEISLLKSAGKIKTKIIVSCDHFYDSYGNFFNVNDIEYVEA